MATITRPAGAYTPQNAIGNTNKYQTDSANNVAISSSKMDGEFNKLFDVATNHDNSIEALQDPDSNLPTAVAAANDNVLILDASDDYSPKKTVLQEIIDLIPTVPAGAVMPFAGTDAPLGWLLCNGAAVSRDTYSDLFDVLGTTFGAGDGSTTFNTPDMRGRITLGLDNIGGSDAGRLDVANTLGGAGGAQKKSSSTDSHTLSINQIPSHKHPQTANEDKDFIGNGGTGAIVQGQTSGGFANGESYQILTKSAGGGEGHAHTITNFDVLPPYLLLNYIIKA